MTDKTQRIVAGLIALALFIGGGALFVVALLETEPPVADLVIGGALVVIALSVGFWAVAERAPKPEPTDSTRRGVDEQGSAGQVRGYRGAASRIPRRTPAAAMVSTSAPTTRFLASLILGLLGAFALGDGLEASFNDEDGRWYFIASAALFLGSQFQLIAGAVTRGIIDGRE